MIYDFNQLRKDYALAYADKSRIKFIETYLSTFNATKGKKTQFHCFPRQRAFLKALAENRNVVAIKPRQCGITTLSSAWVTGQCVFASKEAPETVLCIANKLEQAQEIIIKIRDFLEQVPRWMWGNDYFSPDPNSEKNIKSIFEKDAKGELKLFNGCRVIARASGPNASRGISAVSVLILDEAAFIEEGVAAFTTAAATMASNPNSKTVMVSTPNGRDELYYNTYKQALSKENNFVAVQFRWYQDPRFNKYLVWKKKNEDTGEWMFDQDPIIDEEGGIPYNEERWAKLEHEGWKPSAPWYDEMCKQFNNDSMKIAQELDVSFMGSADNVVAPEYIEMQEKLNTREPLADYADPLVEETWFWKKPIEGHRYILACLPEGEKVLTQRGLVNVEDVMYNDLLITKEGEYTKIKTIMKRRVDDEMIIEILPYSTLSPTKFTWNHKIWSSTNTKLKRNGKRYWDFKWEYIESRNLKNGDWLMIPNIYKINKLSDEEITNKLENEYSDLLLNKDFWWYCGMWIAEGSCYGEEIHNYNIQTAHNADEEKICNKVVNIVENLFKNEVKMYKHNNDKACAIRFNNKTIKNFLLDNFNKGAKNKKISTWIKHLPEKYLKYLLLGYFEGDGVKSKDIKNPKEISFSSVSINLLNDIRDILFSFGIIGTIKKKYDEHCGEIMGRKVHLNEKFELVLSKNNSQKLSNILNLNYKYKIKNRPSISYSFFNEDESYIYVKIKQIKKSKYNGFVYNFTTENESHSYTCGLISVSNCDPSRGVSADRTAIEIIDMDGRDENGLPIIEQVAEYVGKKLGDDIGALCVQYATLYNDAFVVVDCTGGQGDAAILTMLQLGYKNLYYEDSNQKMYTVQRSTKNYDGYTDKLPGFHFQGNRYPVLANFAGLVRNNEFKIRSARVINELETWIFKGENARIDHQEGAHDDTLTSLAMGLFVMQFTLNRIQNTVNKDKSILNAYMMSNAINMNKPKINYGNPITPQNGLPFYNSKNINKTSSIPNGSCMWVFGMQR